METDQKTVLKLLNEGDFEVEGRFMWGSNYTFLTNISLDDEIVAGVYKPVEGEQPLWDFPENTLAGREVCAFLISQAGGWDFVPPTVYRKDGPAGAGSLQLYVEHDPEYHYFEFSPQDKQRLRSVALFDAIINNADRKGGHLLVAEEDQKIWLIDHGICFHVQPKLRTVIWDFAGERFTEAEQAQMIALRELLLEGGELAQKLSVYLTALEVLSITYRINQLLKVGEFPQPSADRHSYPWPPV